MALHLSGLARIGRDAELRFTTNGEPVSNLSLAFNYGRKGEDGKRPTQWVEGVLWGKLAEALNQYLTKGTAVSVLIEDAHIEVYKKGDGTQASKLIGKVASIELAGGGERAAAPAPASAPRQAAPRQAAQRPQQRTSTGFDDMDDDVPF